MTQMTYSRLTLATKYDKVKEQEEIQDEIQYEFEEEDEIQKEENPSEVTDCANCASMKHQLCQIELFLLEIEKKFIEKELHLADQFSALSLELQKKNKELQKSTHFCAQLKQQIQTVKSYRAEARLTMNPAFKPFNTFGLAEQFSRKSLNTQQNAKNAEVRMIRNTLNQSTCMSICQEAEKQNSPIRKKTEPIQTTKKNFISEVDLSYTQSERELTLTADPLKSLSYEQNSESMTDGKSLANIKTLTRIRTKKTEADDFFPTISRDYELSKLRFQNSSLKSYNSVLLEYAKPKTLAQRIFAFRKS